MLCKQLIKILLLLTACLFATLAMSNEIKIGVLSFAPKQTTLARWQPLAHYLEQRIGDTVDILPMNYEELHQAIYSRSVDFVFTNPGDYIFFEQQGLLSDALATQVNCVNDQSVSVFGGVIVSKSDRSNINTLQDLNGLKIASTGPHSLGGHQMQIYELMQVGITPESLHLIWTEMPHDRVIESVLSGEADAGFVRTGTLERMIEKGIIQPDDMKVINQQSFADFPFVVSTHLYSEWPVAALPHVDPTLINQMTAALLLIEHNSPIMASMDLHGFNFATNYEPVKNMLRKIGAPPFEQLPEYYYQRLWSMYRPWIIGAVFFTLIIIRLRISNARINASKQQMDTLVASTPGVVFRCLHDPDWTMEFISPQTKELFGYPAEEFINNRVRSYASIIHPDDLNHVDDVIQQGLSHQVPYSLEYRIIHRDGTIRWVYEKGQGVFNDHGEAINIVGTITNHTAEHQISLFELEKEKYSAISTLVGGVAHNFNNKLAAMYGQLYLVREKNKENPEQQKHLKLIEDTAFEMAELIKLLLTYIQHDYDAMESISLGQILEETIRAFMVDFHAKLDVQNTEAAESLLVWGRHQQLQSAIAALLSNAKDATTSVDEPVIKIRLETAPPSPDWLRDHPSDSYDSNQHYLNLSIEDNGTGIPAKDLPHVTEPFFTTKEQGKGLGLGLSFVAGVVSEMDGLMGIDSTDQGTHVQIYVPKHSQTSTV